MATDSHLNPSAEGSFDRAFREYGGRLDLSTVHPTTRDGMQGLLDYYRWLLNAARFADPPYNPTGNLTVDFVDNAEVNATAFVSNQLELIGINWGLVALIYQAFYLLMSSPTVLPNIGDAEVEKAEKRNIDALLQPQSWKLMESLLPKDGDRVRVAQHLAWNAMAFVFAHEVSHVCRAHLRYLKTTFGIDRHVEYRTVRLSESQARTLQALELDADTAAAETNLILWTKLCRRGTFPLLTEVPPLTTWSLSLSMFFHVLDMKTKPHESALRSHPKPAVRLLQVSYNASDCFGELEFPDAHRCIGEGWGIIGKWWQQNELSAHSLWELDEHLDRTIDTLNELRSESGELIGVLRQLAEERNHDIRMRKKYDNHILNTEPNKTDAGDVMLT
ncbi:MAG: hypothetical protein FJ264_04425 [Planctomycetes bacterium]|nr:hypothetical protein [Planctomycetota bacterium]